jgi:hypothetical protein
MDQLDSGSKNNTATPGNGVLKAKRRRWRFRFPHSWKDVKALGWKMILAFVLFYLIRDTLLYIVIPYLIYKGIISF